MTKRALLAEQPDSAAHGAVEPDAIRLQLGRLVESPSFRSSKRCRLFLEHAVEHALSPNATPLKEREVGMQVFGRVPSYDTAADPVVRVTAGEIRRRLEQYYAEPAHQRELRVELPAGGYTRPSPGPRTRHRLLPVGRGSRSPRSPRSVQSIRSIRSIRSARGFHGSLRALWALRDRGGGHHPAAFPRPSPSTSPSTASVSERHAAYAGTVAKPPGHGRRARGIAIFGVIAAAVC